MNRCILLMSLLVLAAGCDKGGVTDVEIRINNGFLTPAEPIEVAPGVAVHKNDFTSWDGGFRGRQRLKISGSPAATLILVPSRRAFGVFVPDTILYVGRRANVRTAIEINRRTWQYRRIDLDSAPADVDDDHAMFAQLERAPWVAMGDYRLVAFRSLLWAWWVTTPATASRPPYRRPSDGRKDRLILHPHEIFGTTGDPTSPEPPPEWNALIHTLREFCPPHGTTAQADTQPSTQ